MGCIVKHGSTINLTGCAVVNRCYHVQQSAHSEIADPIENEKENLIKLHTRYFGRWQFIQSRESLRSLLWSTLMPLYQRADSFGLENRMCGTKISYTTYPNRCAFLIVVSTA